MLFPKKWLAIVVILVKSVSSLLPKRYGLHRDPTICTDLHHNASTRANTVTHTFTDTQCARKPCNLHSFCYLGVCVCHPGYDQDCNHRMEVANPWYTAFCPNLQHDLTFNITTPIHLLGGEYTQFTDTNPSAVSAASVASVDKFCRQKLKACAYLCYAHPLYGTAVVPLALWQQAQIVESRLWAGITGIENDRAEEHWRAFDSFLSLSPQRRHLGKVIEVGAGPWTQLKGILHVRPELQVDEFTVWEPSAER